MLDCRAMDIGGRMVMGVAAAADSEADRAGILEADSVGCARLTEAAKLLALLLLARPFSLLAAPRLVTLSSKKSLVALKSEFSFFRELISFFRFSICFLITATSSPLRSHSGIRSRSLNSLISLAPNIRSRFISSPLRPP